MKNKEINKNLFFCGYWFLKKEKKTFPWKKGPRGGEQSILVKYLIKRDTKGIKSFPEQKLSDIFFW